jgi:hypothetical protein
MICPTNGLFAFTFSPNPATRRQPQELLRVFENHSTLPPATTRIDRGRLLVLRAK